MTPQEIFESSRTLLANLNELVNAGRARRDEVTDLANRVFSGEPVDWPLEDGELLSLAMMAFACTIAVADNGDAYHAALQRRGELN